MRKADSVYLPAVRQVYHAAGEDADFDEGGDAVHWAREIRCMVHSSQFLQVHVTWHDGVKESITYCGPFLIEWAEDSLDG